MRLYFFRHGLAGDSTLDHDRQLTEKGVSNTRQAASLLKALGVKPDHLYSSPLVRAQQTADILAQALNVEVQANDQLASGFSILAVEALTKDLGEAAEIMFVGHEPSLSTTISSLVGGRVVMKRGGLARVDIVSMEPLLGELVWLIAPKVFEQAKS